MRVVIVEDEERAANRLKQLLNEVDNSIEVIAEMETVRDVVTFDWSSSAIELIFLDIHLADGSSFDIFHQISIEVPIIFTTAYDQYALEAFEVNSVDYLLKPIDPNKLKNAIHKWEKWQYKPNNRNTANLNSLIEQLSSKKEYTRNLLVAHKHKLLPIPTEEFAIFYIDNSVIKGVTFAGQQYFPEQNLDELESVLDPKIFYRASRQFILHLNCIVGIESYFNSRLLINTNPQISEEILVSKAKAKEFKNWVKGQY